MQHRFVTFAAVPALAAAGLLAALVFASTASAWSPSDLPPGFYTDRIVDVAPSSPCPEAYRLHSPSSFSDPFCTNSPTYQQDFDAWIDARYTAPATTTATTDTFSSTTTDASTSPATTTAPTSTQPAPPATTDYQAQIDDLKSQVSALKLRVDHLEAAADAEWLSYHDALGAGVDPVIASMIARQTGYDLIHGTGIFSSKP